MQRKNILYARRVATARRGTRCSVLLLREKRRQRGVGQTFFLNLSIFEFERALGCLFGMRCNPLAYVKLLVRVCSGLCLRFLVSAIDYLSDTDL